MNIGYLTKQNPEDRKAYSGIHYSMLKALREQFMQVTPLGPVDSAYRIIPKLQGRVLRLMSGQIYKYQYNVRLCKRMSSIIERKIESVNRAPDAILASLMTPEVAHLTTSKPLFLTADATFPRLHNLYASHSNLHPKSVREARELEQRAYRKATKILFPLQWLADSAMADYDVPPGKIEVLPYGANVDHNTTEAEMEQIITHRVMNSVLNLLFVGVRWQEKGGPFAVAVHQELLKKGVESRLTVVGCRPEGDGFAVPEGVEVTGFLDKSVQEDSATLNRLYRESSFFILPTRAECVGISFLEAASFGLPAVGTGVGGVPEAVLHNKTGMIISENQSPAAVAEWLLNQWRDKQEYHRMAMQAYRRQRELFNWSRWARDVRRVIEREV